MMTDACSTAAALATSARLLKLLDAYIVCDVESYGVRARHHGQPGERWYDVRPMLDEREHAPEFIDMAQLAIEQGVASGVLRRDPALPYMVQCQEVDWP